MGHICVRVCACFQVCLYNYNGAVINLTSGLPASYVTITDWLCRVIIWNWMSLGAANIKS